MSDTTGRPDPKYFRLWDHIADKMKPADRLAGKAGKPKPDFLYKEAEGALDTLASQWAERFELIQAASDAADKTPPVMIVVCDNVNVAEVFYRNISGETMEEEVEVEETRRGGDRRGGSSAKAKKTKRRA
ncbi:MAG: hypothetical protein WKF75_17310 [Singulisphaera sp.]